MKVISRKFEQSDVDSPWQYGLSDWWAVIKRTLVATRHDNVSVIAAGVAFFSLLAIFPLISAALSIFSYFTDAGDVQSITDSLAALMPQEAYAIIEGQIVSVLSTSNTQLSARIFFSLAFAIFAAGAGIRAMMRAMNVAYEEIETRNFAMFNLDAILMTLGSLLFVWLSLIVIIGVPSTLAFIQLEGSTDTVIRIIPWILIITIFALGCGVMYRFGPARRPARKRWIFPGIALAMVSWFLISFGFSKFVQQFGTYNETFGGLASVIILLVWFWLTAMAIIIGAELNSELERQTTADTTRGPFRELGDRGAAMADYVADSTDDKSPD